MDGAVGNSSLINIRWCFHNGPIKLSLWASRASHLGPAYELNGPTYESLGPLPTTHLVGSGRVASPPPLLASPPHLQPRSQAGEQKRRRLFRLIMSDDTGERDRYGVLLYYKYASVPDVDELVSFYESNCSSLGLLGRVRVAPHGVNVTVRLTSPPFVYLFI